MLGEASKLWNKQTPAYRKKKEEEWESRYGKDWRKHVAIQLGKQKAPYPWGFLFSSC